MSRIKESDKRLLKETTLWQEFYEERLALQATGTDAAIATEECLAKYLPRAQIIKEQFTPAAIGVSGEGEQPKGSKSSLIEIPKHIMDAPHDIVKTIEYVAKYLEIGLTHETVKEAPCAAAASMLRSYSASVSRKNLFWDKKHSDLMPAKSDLEKKDKETYDGEILKDMAVEIAREMAKYKEKEYVEN